MSKYSVKQGDCLELMKEIPDKSIDMILCDLPYGTTQCSWDTVIPFDKLWEQYTRITKDNSAIVLFGSEPFSSQLRCSNLKNYKYDLYWKKEKPTNFMQLKRRFGKVTENICVFYSKQPTYNPQMVEYKGRPVKNSYSENVKDAVDDEKTESVDQELKALVADPETGALNRGWTFAIV